MSAVLANAKAIAQWVAKTPWIGHLAKVEATRSNTSVWLVVNDPAVTRLSLDEQAAFAKSLAGLLEKEGVAYDIAFYRDAPPGLRIWCGATVEAAAAALEYAGAARIDVIVVAVVP